MTEKKLLPRDIGGQIKTLEMRADMEFEPFLPRPRPHETLDIAAQVKARAAPVSCRIQRHFDAMEIRGALPVPGIIKRMIEQIAGMIGAIALEQSFVQR